MGANQLPTSSGTFVAVWDGPSFDATVMGRDDADAVPTADKDGDGRLHVPTNSCMIASGGSTISGYVLVGDLWNLVGGLMNDDDPVYAASQAPTHVVVDSEGRVQFSS